MPAFSLSNNHHAFSAPKHLAARRSILGRRGHRGEAASNPDVLRGFPWPARPTLESIGLAISACRGLEIVVRPIPDGLSHHEISGLTTVTGRTAHVFYDPGLSPLNREQTILHEYAHILHGDVMADSDTTHLRSVFDDPVEKRAETTGMRLLDRLHRGRPMGGSGSTAGLLAFLSGDCNEEDLR